MAFTASTFKTKENPGERYFTWFCDELVSAGYLKSYSREPETINVLKSYPHLREHHLKTKENTFIEFNLLQEINYTYDYRLIWTDKALYIFTEIFQPKGYFKFNTPQFISHEIMINGVKEIVSYIDVKPHFAAAQFGGGKMASYYSFPYIQKFLLTMRGLYINKVIPTNTGSHGISTCLFAKVFVPSRYLYTDAGKQLRKIPFRKSTIVHYVNRRQAIIDGFLQMQKAKDQKGTQGTLL